MPTRRSCSFPVSSKVETKSHNIPPSWMFHQAKATWCFFRSIRSIAARPAAPTPWSSTPFLISTTWTPAANLPRNRRSSMTPREEIDLLLRVVTRLAQKQLGQVGFIPFVAVLGSNRDVQLLMPAGCKKDLTHDGGAEYRD